jgi:hypothetical protein
MKQRAALHLRLISGLVSFGSVAAFKEAFEKDAERWAEFLVHVEDGRIARQVEGHPMDKYTERSTHGCRRTGAHGRPETRRPQSFLREVGLVPEHAVGFSRGVGRMFVIRMDAEGRREEFREWWHLREHAPERN